MKIILVSCVFLFLSYFQVIAQILEIQISNINSCEGMIELSVYENEDGFDEDIYILRKRYSKEAVNEGELLVSLEIPPGTYGIALHDDENNDGEMNYSFLGIPREGFGFSNYYLRGLKRPIFSDFSFDLSQDVKQLSIKVKYM